MAPSPPAVEPNAPRPWVRLARITFGFFAGAAILFVAASLMGVSRQALVDALKNGPWWTAPASAVSLFILYLAHAARWNRSLQPVLGNTYWQGYWAMLITYPLNAVLPAHAGDLIRVNLLSTRTGVSRATILGAEILDKGMDFCGPLPATALLLAFDRSPSWLTKGVGLILLGIFGIALFVVAARARAPSTATWLGRALGKLRDAYLGRDVKQLMLTAGLFASLPWVGEAVVLYVLGNGFGIPLTPVEAFCVLVGLKVGMAVPTPGGIGSVEAAGAAALVFFGAEPAHALALMLIYRTSQLAAGSVVGTGLLALPVRFRRVAAVP